MAWGNQLKEAANARPLFLTIYATVIIGIFVSSFYVFSAVFSSSNSVSSPWFSTSAPSVDVAGYVQILMLFKSYYFEEASSPSFSQPSNASRQIVVSIAPDPASVPESKFLKPLWKVPPPGSKMPPLETFKLTKELVQQRVKDNIIVVTFGNFAFMDFILTWVKHLSDMGIDNLLVGAMDTKLLEALYWKGIPVFDMGSHMSTIDVGWGSPTFHKMGREKVILIDSILPYGFELLMCDTDMVWLKNPLPYLARYPDADVLTSTDQVSPTVVDDQLEDWRQAGAAYNIGIFHWRPTETSMKLAKEWKELLLADEKIWDQNGFNELVRRQLGPPVDEDSGLVYAYDGNLKLGLLPASIFCSGHTYFVQAAYQQLKLEPYAVHTTFQYAGTDGKRHRLREAMVFFDPPEYYDTPGGFLTFKPNIPKSLLLDGQHNIESHFALVNYQIKQIRTALAIASLLGRTLVMPPLWCRLDRLWFGHPGVLVGTLTRQPFICPLDHVFEVNVMLKEFPEEELGPGINFREYSFFDNPSVPQQVKNSWLDVHLCQEGSHGCEASNSTTQVGILKFPKRSTEEKFKTIFSSFKDVKVIQFSSMQDAFLGFRDKACCSQPFSTLIFVFYLSPSVNLATGHVMLTPKIQTKFTKSIQKRSLATIVNSSPLFRRDSLNKIPQILYFPQCSSWTLFQEFRTHAVLPVETSVSRIGFADSQVAGRFSFASQLLDEMSERKQQKSECTLLWDVFKIVQSVVSEPNVGNAALVHALAVKQGALADLCTATSLLTVYSRCKEFGSAVALFGEVLDRDVVFWNAMMSACVENRSFQAAVGFFKKMVGEGYEFDSTTLVIVISAFADLRSLGQGKGVHGLSVKAGMLSDTVLSNALINMYAKCGDLSSSECMFAGINCKDLITWNSIISGCFYNNHPEKSLWFFRRMASYENQADDMSISCAIAACTSLQEFGVGLAIHGLGIKLGYGENNHISVANSLISFYSQFRDIHATETVFKGMVVKNVVSWNAMIKGFFLNEQAEEAFYLLRAMQFVALIQPDIATVVTIIPFCAELLLLREGKAAHGFTIRREMASELSVINSLINMYSKCNNLKEAEYLFLTMPKKDVVAWNTMIFGYAQNGQSQEAQTLFKNMLGCYSTCTLPTLLAITPSCDSPESLQFGRSIHGWSIKLGYSNQIFALNSLTHMYISCGALSDAFTLFRGISAKADVTGWNTVIAGCTQKGQFWEALEYFDLFRKASQFHANPIIVVSVVSACGNLGLTFQGTLIHGLAFKTGAVTNMRVQNSLVTMYGRLGDTESATLAFNLSHDHNLCSWNCVISALSQNEDAKKAIELFRSLEFEPNERTISTVLSACTQLGAMTYGKQIHGHVFRFGFHQNPFISAALVDMYSNCGRLEIAELVFLSLPERSVAAWNSLVSAYGFHNYGSKAIETFQEMIRSGVRPTNGSFTSLLSACSHAGLVNEGRMYYDNMFVKFKVQPATEHHVCMVDMLGRSGRLQEAYDFIKNLPTQPDPGIWSPTECLQLSWRS
ncbi:UNVERIFIED_CONTAM: Arabinosyltransferase [Sesamum angustifolium]|uniref:Arabinosyltransferase n=1 Tax=Sesamum angustifolium TaxID=2727405 RepID=A0AAW2K9M3_9LAMI